MRRPQARLLGDRLEALDGGEDVVLQEALDEAMKLIPNATIGILPKGGISLPVLKKL